MTTATRPAPVTLQPDRRVLGLAVTSGAVFLVATVLACRADPFGWELSAFRAVNGLPDWLYYVVWPFMQYGVFVTIPVAAAIALVVARRRLAVLLAVSGVGIYLAAKVVKDVTTRGRPGAFLADVQAREHFATGSLGYTSGHLAVAATIATLTVAHLRRPWREISVALVAIVAFGRMYVGAHLPLDIVGGIAMGVATGAAATYLFGADRARPQEGSPMTATISLTGEPTPSVDEQERLDTVPPPSGRHPGDAVRVGLGLAGLAISALAVQRDRLTAFETDLFRLINDLPSQVSPILTVIMQAGNVVAAPAAALVMLVVARRHRRAALDVAGAGVVAWFAAKAVKGVVQRPRPTGFLADVLRATGDGLGFVSGHTAVAAAIVTAVGPYLPRPWRRALWVLPWVVGFTRVYMGAHLPLDIVGGAALGWAIGSAIHLLLGAPHRVPGLPEAHDVLRRAGHGPVDLRRVSGRPQGSFPFVATTEQGSVFVKLLDPEPRDRDWLYRAARFLAFRDVRDEAAVLDPSTLAHREAAMGLLARTHGARVPAIQGIEHDRGQVWLVEEHVAGHDLEHLPPASVTDAVLRDVWTQVSRLHTGRVAHRDLVASNVVLNKDGRAWIVDFAHAESAAPGRTLDNDVAELLASTSLIVGPDRAVATAKAVLGDDALGRALPELQPLSLTAGTRHRLRASPDGLHGLRHHLAARLGLDLESSDPARHHSRRHLAATAVSLIVAVGGLVALAGPGAVGREITSAGYRWLGLAALALMVMELSRASGIIAAIHRRLAVGWTTLAHLSALSSATLDGRRIGRGELISYLGRAGVPEDEAGPGLRLVRRAALATWLAAVVTAAAATWWLDVPLAVPDQVNVLLLLAVVASAPLLATVPHRRPRPTRHDGGRWSLGDTDGPILALASGGATAAGALVTVAATAAMGGGVAVVGVIAVHLLVTGLADRSPIAGAPGAGEIVMAGGLMVLGLPVAPAVAAALTARLLLVWCPVVAGHLLRAPLRRRLLL